mgnify:FL=1
MDWNQLNLEEVELDFNKSSKRMKMDENVMEIDLEINLEEIKTKINKLKGEVADIMHEINKLHFYLYN